MDFERKLFFKWNRAMEEEEVGEKSCVKMDEKVKNLLLYFNETPDLFEINFIEYDYFRTMASYEMMDQKLNLIIMLRSRRKVNEESSC